jgi:hypothetical protein
MKILYWCRLKTEEQGTKYQKINLQGFVGHQVSLNVQKAELERFKGGKSEGFRKVKK